MAGPVRCPITNILHAQIKQRHPSYLVCSECESDLHTLQEINSNQPQSRTSQVDTQSSALNPIIISSDDDIFDDTPRPHYLTRYPLSNSVHPPNERRLPTTLIAPGAQRLNNKSQSNLLYELQDSLSTANHARSQSIRDEPRATREKRIRASVSLALFCGSYSIEKIGGMNCRKWVKIGKYKGVSGSLMYINDVFPTIDMCIQQMLRWAFIEKEGQEKTWKLVHSITQGNGMNVVDVAINETEPVSIAQLKRLTNAKTSTDGSFTFYLLTTAEVETSVTTTNRGKSKRKREYSDEDDNNLPSPQKPQVKGEELPEVSHNQTKTEVTETVIKEEKMNIERKAKNRRKKYNLPPPLQTRSVKSRQSEDVETLVVSSSKRANQEEMDEPTLNSIVVGVAEEVSLELTEDGLDSLLSQVEM